MSKVLTFIILFLFALLVRTLLGVYVLDTVVVVFGLNYTITWAHGMTLSVLGSYFHDDTKDIRHLEDPKVLGVALFRGLIWNPAMIILICWFIKTFA